MAKEIGGIDIPALGQNDIFIEVVNSAVSGTPDIYATGVYSSLQFDPRKPTANGQLIHKCLKYIIPNNGGTLQVWTPNFSGATIKRIFFMYGGTDWTATANGNLSKVLLKKNSVAVFENMECLDMRFLQLEQRKVPQSRMYAMDFMVDNVSSAALGTRNAKSLQFDISLTAADSVSAIVECLDVPGNL